MRLERLDRPSRASSGPESDPPGAASARAQPLIEEAAERSRLSARARGAAARRRAVDRPGDARRDVAWLVATEVVGHARPFFAPVSAMITLGLTQGERGRRAPSRSCSA